MKSLFSARRRQSQLLGIGCALLLTAGLLHWKNWLQAHPIENRTRFVQAKPGVFIPTLSETSKKEILDKAKFLRDRWRPWAEAHHEELQRLFDAPPDGRTAMLTVWNQIPNPEQNNQTGITVGDINMGRWDFDWPSSVDKMQKTLTPEVFRKNPKLAADWKRAIQQNYSVRDENFRQHRDIALCSSVNPGLVSYTLWISGRITESRLSAEPSALRRHDAKETEIQPRYQFLK